MKRAVAVACLLLAGAAMRAEIIDRVLATVDGRVITLSAARAVEALGLVHILPGEDSRDAIVQRLVDRVLVLEEVARYAPPEPDPAAVTKGVAAVRVRFPSDAAFQAALHELGIEQRFVEQWVRNDLRISGYLDQRFAGAVEPTEDELENYRRQHASELEQAGQAQDETALLNEARIRVTADRRRALIRKWIQGLRARADITVNPPPSGG
jgi:hypothetical protein